MFCDMNSMQLTLLLDRIDNITAEGKYQFQVRIRGRLATASAPGHKFVLMSLIILHTNVQY